MQIKDVSAQPTADLLRVFVTGGIQDTALGGAVARELEERGVARSRSTTSSFN